MPSPRFDCEGTCHVGDREPIRRPELTLLVLVISCLFACSRHHDPQAAYDHARQTFRHGDLGAARVEAEKGYAEFHSVSAEWAWKFAILRASTLHRQGLDAEVVKQMNLELAPPPSGDLAVRRERLLSVAHSSLHDFRDAEQSLATAEQLCAVSDYPACADVVTTRGGQEMKRGHFAQAQVLFARALASARSNGDRFLEATAFLNLSWSADEQTHFDEALDWANNARRISMQGNFAGVAETALGNEGWAYYKLGDSEKARQLLVEARSEAQNMGYLTDEVRWLTNAGYIYLDDRDFKTAEQSFQQSLTLARQINSREDITNSLIALAFLSEQTNKLDDAKRYADEALTKAREDKNGRDQVYPLLVLGRVAARQRDTTAAENAFREVAQSPDCPVFLKWEAERSLARLYEDEKQFGFCQRRVSNRAHHLRNRPL